MSEAKKFQHIIDGMREDLALIENLYMVLDGKISNMVRMGGFLYEKTSFEIKEWTTDVFLDKLYDIDSKVYKFLNDISLEEIYKKVSIQEMEKCLKDIVQQKKGFGNPDTFSNLAKLKKEISYYRESFDSTMNDVRKSLYKANWTNMNKVSLEDYLLLTERQKYITARQELEWVKQAVKNGQYEDVLNHLRTAIGLAIMDRFGFKDIKKMWHFLNDAEAFSFPLPSIDMLYFYYDEGSDRLHAGRLHTPFECRQALHFVDGFIDELELIPISQEEIDNFKKKCKWVE